MLYRFQNSIFIGPSTMKPRSDCAIDSLAALGPFSHRVRFAVDRELRIVSFIICLFKFCCPAHIARFVIAVIVRKAVNGMVRARALSDMVKERLKAIEPFGTNLDTSAAIPMEVRAARVDTPIFHMFPAFVFRRIACAVFVISLRDLFSLQATTAFGSACAKLVSFHRKFHSAPAQTEPTTFFLNNADERNNRQSKKDLTGKVNFRKIVFSHLAYLQCALVRSRQGLNTLAALIPFITSPGSMLSFTRRYRRAL